MINFMVCMNCGQYGIVWKNLASIPYTFCPHCEGTNCQMPQEPEDSEDDEDCPICGCTGEEVV